MENLALIGLSRQIALHRELEVVANNIANMNTTGYKSDGSVFHEFLMPVARTGALPGHRPAPELRARPRDLAQFRHRPAQARPAIRSTSRSTATPSWSCRRHAASAIRATASLQINATGELVTNERRPRARRRRADPVPADRQQHLDQSGRHDHGARGRQRRLRLGRAASSGWSASSRCRRLLKDGASMFRAPAGAAPQAGRDQRARRPGHDRAIQCAPGRRDGAHDRADAHLHADREHVAAGERAPPQRHRQACRSSGLSERRHPCERFIPQRPEWWPRNSTSRSSPTTSPTCARPATSASVRNSRTCSTSTSAASAPRPRRRATSFPSASISAAA